MGENVIWQTKKMDKDKWRERSERERVREQHKGFKVEESKGEKRSDSAKA